MFSKLYAIAGNTFTETIRQPIFVILMLAAGFLLVINPSLAAFSLESGKDSKIMIDVGLATLLLYGLLACSFSATSVITREIESHTVLTVVSKPVSRPLFITGKYFGVVAALLVGFYFLCLIFLMTVRHGVMETNADKLDGPVLVFGTLAVLVSVGAATFCNYVYSWHFTTTLTAFLVPTGSLALLGVLLLSREWKPQPIDTDFGNLQVLYAVLLIFFAVAVLAAFAVAIATRFSQVTTLILCAGVLIGGLMMDYAVGRHLDGARGQLQKTEVRLAATQPAVGDELAALQREKSRLRTECLRLGIAYALLPNFQYFWVGDAITQDEKIVGDQVAAVAGYAALYALAALGLAVALFQTREVS